MQFMVSDSASLFTQAYQVETSMLSLILVTVMACYAMQYKPPPILPASPRLAGPLRKIHDEAPLISWLHDIDKRLREGRGTHLLATRSSLELPSTSFA